MQKLTQIQKLEIANEIINTCYWGNMRFTPQTIIDYCANKETAEQIFSAIFQNSNNMFNHLSLIDNEWVKEMIISQNQRLGYHKRDFLETRLDELIAHYGIKDAGKRREIYRVV
ncbi:hypothetical protein [Helicobacter sp. T3_23-1059]